MKRRMTCLAALLLSLLLCGCGTSRASQQQAELAQTLCERRQLRFEAQVRAEYPDKTVCFRLDYAEDDKGCYLTVQKPEEIRGIQLRLGIDGTQLRLEDLTLDAGPLDRYGLSPVSALPALTRALREGHLEHAWTEGELQVWELIADDTLTVRVWLDDTPIPRRAELISEGRVAVYCEIENWHFAGE